MTRKDHPLSPEAQIRAAKQAYIGELPEGMLKTRSSVHICNGFTVKITDHLSVDCAYDMNFFGSTFEEAPSYTPDPDVRYASASAELAGERYSHDTVVLHIPDWAAASGGAPMDPATITLRLAHGVECPETVFPAHENTISESQDHIHEALKIITARTLSGITWLLDRLEGGCVRMDLDQIRVEAASDIYDGHGRLLACRMRLRPDDLKAFIASYGEEEFRRALLEGHLYQSGQAALDGTRYKADRVQTLYDRLMGRAEAKIGFFPYVSWSEEAFETAIRPHLPDGPFSGGVGSINGRNAALALLEERMGLAPQAPSHDPEPA